MPRSTEPIEPTKTESKNGWGEKELAAYVAARNNAAADKILHRGQSNDIAVENMKRYDPHHHWRRGGR